MAQKHDTRPPQTGGVKPGDEDFTVMDDRARPDDSQQDEHVTRKERKVVKSIVPFMLIALIIATVVLALLTQRWIFLLALIVFVPYLFLISAPLWLASSTKVAQDEEAREQGKPDSTTPKEPNDLPPPRGPTEPGS